MKPPSFTPYDYQRDAKDFMKLGSCALFAEPGTGKTAISLSLLDEIYWQFRGVLIIAPLRVCTTVWPEEIKKWGFDFSYQILHGKDRFKALNRSADLYIINCENIFWLLDWMSNTSNRDWPFDTLIVDESSKFKAQSSKRFKQLRRHLKRFQRRYILTGTPAANSLLDLWSQMHIVDCGKTLGTSFTVPFKFKYFYQPNPNGYGWDLLPGAEERVNNAIAPYAMYIKASDHLDLPEILYNNVYVDLPDSAREVYDTVETQLFFELEQKEHLISSAAAAYGACRQIAGGRMYEPKDLFNLELESDKRNVLEFHQEKLKATRDIVEELQGKPVLVAYHYRHELEALKKEFGQNTPFIGSGVSGNETAAIIKKWNAGKLPLLFGHPMSMSHGLNLQKGGHDIVWFTLSDSLDNYIQYNNRLHRQGVREQVRIHHILARNTIDEAVLDRLQSKSRTQQALLDAIKRYRKRQREQDDR